PGAYKQIPGDLIGKTYFEAQIELQNLGINSIRAEDYSDKIPVDKIMTVNPEENSNIKYRDETVTLTVSKGIKYIDFPNSLKDKTTADLANVLTQLGFINIVVENEYSLTVKEGKLIKSSVKEGTKLRWDTKIVLLNSKGPKPITFPNVVGQTQTNAKTVLEALSLKVEVKTSYSDDVKKGLVISQDPSASAKGFEGQQITITVSLGPPITTVPNVVGLSVSQAHEKLRAANLKWTDTGVSVLGLVQKQSVSGGQTVNIGATITLTIV
ncbi:MAG: PASTA domain-containing protein, partial [Bifidobacteriaceae bacterium]|nr:PASTA domain-containing protein [Bifidobacteriaceae bacterium]